MTENYKQYKTFDMALASALVAYGFGITNIERTQYGGKVSFIFDHRDGLDETIQTYWADELKINPRTYFDAMKHIKTRMYAES